MPRFPIPKSSANAFDLSVHILAPCPLRIGQSLRFRWRFSLEIIVSYAEPPFELVVPAPIMFEPVVPATASGSRTGWANTP